VMILFVSIPLFLFLYSGRLKAALFYAIAAFIGQVTHAFIMSFPTGEIVNMLFVMIAGMISRMLPGLAMGYYLLSTTTVSEFIASMERMKIPKNIIIPFAVMFRFFPTIAEEARFISDAMRMRGVSFGSRKFFQNPLAMIEYRLIPLLISTVKIGEELSAASLTRGLGNPHRRTNICKSGFGVSDCVFALFAGAALSYYFYTIYFEKVIN
jgi:energy-coupling factor transporter transmembrane protein EcfT